MFPNTILKQVKNYISDKITHFLGSRDPFGNHLIVGYPETPYLPQTPLCSSQSTCTEESVIKHKGPDIFFPEIHHNEI